MKTPCRFVAVVIVFLPLMCCSTAPGQAPDSDRAMNSLAPFIGKWNKEWTVHKSEWTPKEQQATGVHTWDWILEKQHMQETGKDSTGSTYISIWSYNKAARSYRVASFQSSGNSVLMNGQWDSKSRTFTATHEMPGGVKMTATYVLKNKDLFQFSYVATDNSGKIYFNLQGTGKRDRHLK